MGITAKELAKKLNLSEAAVSMALNQKPGVSTRTRQRVMECARNEGYDFTHKSVGRLPSGIINIVIYRKHGAVVTDTPFFSSLLDGINQEYKASRYQINIIYLYKDDNIQQQLEHMIYSNCIGMILLATEMSREDFEPFRHLSIPIVILDNYFDDVSRDSILINNRQGSFQAASYLISHRKSQPGYLHSSYSIHNFEERSAGFSQAIKASGMSLSKSIIHSLSPSLEGAYADMLSLLQQGCEVADCYFADNDLIAAGAMRAFREMGYHMPKDIAIIGFDNIPICAYLVPNLTTVEVPKEYMGKMAALRLNQILEASEWVPVKTEIQTTIVERKSV